jgi:hypothetical protein
MPQSVFEDAWGRRLMTKREFVDAIGRAVCDGTGYAAGKLGGSERAWLLYPLLLERGLTPLQRRAFEQSLKHKATGQAGAFPGEGPFLSEFARFYACRLRELDCLGVSTDSFRVSLDIACAHRFSNQLIRYIDQEPDRSSPADDERCYLPHFRDKRVLLVCPFADALRARADKKTFEAVWAKTGKRWFYPASVEAVEFPYGFARSTQKRYGTCLDLLDEITAKIDGHDYDVALIGAGALGVPIATHVKQRSKVGLSLGGALQVLFGVIGRRWRTRPSWQRRYFNSAWVDVPPEYRPASGETDADYW